MNSLLRVVLPLAAALAFSCGEHHGHDHGHGDHDHADHDHGDGDHDHSGHVHVAPNDGYLVPVGEEFANVELLLDEETGQLTAWCWDGCAENPIKLSVETLALLVLGDDGAEVNVELAAVASTLTGETVGDTAKFEAVVPELVGRSEFSGELVDITIKGQQAGNVSFHYCLDEEHDHTDGDHEGHDHDEGHSDDHAAP